MDHNNDFLTKPIKKENVYSIPGIFLVESGILPFDQIINGRVSFF